MGCGAMEHRTDMPDDVSAPPNEHVADESALCSKEAESKSGAVWPISARPMGDRPIPQLSQESDRNTTTLALNLGCWAIPRAVRSWIWLVVIFANQVIRIRRVSPDGVWPITGSPGHTRARKSLPSLTPPNEPQTQKTPHTSGSMNKY